MGSRIETKEDSFWDVEAGLLRYRKGAGIVARPRGSGALTHGCDHTGGVVGGKREARRWVHGCGGGQHVAGVREGREGGHVAGQGGRAEGAALVHQALGEVVHAVLGLFALLGLTRHLPVPGLDAFLLHGQRSVDLLSKEHKKDGRLVFLSLKTTNTLTENMKNKKKQENKKSFGFKKGFDVSWAAYFGGWIDILYKSVMESHLKSPRTEDFCSVFGLKF